MSDGFSFNQAKKAKVSLFKAGNWAAAKALDYLVSGAFREPVVAQLVGPEKHQLCHRCGG